MSVPVLKKSETRLVLTIGDHQDEQNPKSLTELADDMDEEIGNKLFSLQRGKSMVDEGYVRVEREHPKAYFYLTEDGQELYEALCELRDILCD